uniref:F-box/FBD/LRR-repeat protein At4g00160-like n=1 Tax=Erigeron canadensis TaxID=72917 RepID=UPI001CB92669|nr:F-box/FBD/LRR-repeat protein At4g00160-like [Erigeron canadensis]
MSNSTLPSALIEKILWDLPTKELVRTSILSKEWRYFWTEIPKVAFREEVFDDELTTSDEILMDNVDEDEDATNIDLFKYLPLIEHLTLCYFGGGALRQALAASLVHLKSVYLESRCLLEEDWLRSLVLIIRSSPNLEKLKLQEGVNFCDTQPEFEFVKFIMANSPVLKTLRLKVYGIDEELKLLSLEHAPHASPMVEIIGDCWRWSMT